MMDILSASSIQTDFGEIVCVWQMVNNSPKINRIFLSNPESLDPIFNSAQKAQLFYFPNAISGNNAIIDELLEKIRSFLAGNEVLFNFDYLNFENCWERQPSIILREAQIPLRKCDYLCSTRKRM